MERPAVSQLSLKPGAKMPNSHLPVLIYKNALPPSDRLERELRHCFEKHGWGGAWTNGVYLYDHFHCNAHEVLGVAAGWIELQLGGDEGEMERLTAGEIVVLPAGTGHRRLRASGGYSIVGAYPRGQETPNNYRSVTNCANYRNRLNAVPMPDQDPVLGKAGPLLRTWRDSALEQLPPSPATLALTASPLANKREQS